MANLVQVHKPRQLEPIETLVAKVEVTFDVLNPIAPDSVVQIYASGRSDTPLTPAALIEDVDLHENEHFGYSKILELQAGAFFFLHFCPRTKTDGVLDPEIDDQPFDSFCTVIPVTTRALQPPSSGPLTAPSISSIEPHQPTLHAEGNIVVRWHSPDRVDKYHFMWTDTFPPPRTVVGWHTVELEVPNSFDFGFRIPNALPGRTFTFKVQGCRTFVDADKCSPFSADIAIVMSGNTHRLREFLRLSNAQLNPGVRSLGAPVFSAGIRKMMRL